MHLWTTEASSFIFMLFLLLYPFPIPVPVPISDSGFLVFQTPHVTLSLTQFDESLMSLIENKRSIILYLLSCLCGTSSYDFGFRLVSAEKRTPGGGKRRGMVPRSDVLTSGFMRSFLARIFFYLPGSPEKVANQEGYLRRSKRFDHITDHQKESHIKKISFVTVRM